MMRTSEQSHWQWAVRGVGGVVTLIEFLIDDGISPGVDALKELALQHSRITDLLTRGELLYRQATGEKTNAIDQALENEQRLRDFGREPQQQVASEQVRGAGVTLHETEPADTIDFVGPPGDPGSAA